MLKKVGETESGQDVVSGVFQAFATHGVPLSILFQGLEDHGLIVSWPHFWESAQKDGWTIRTMMGTVGGAVGDVHGAKYREEWERRLSFLMRN